MDNDGRLSCEEFVLAMYLCESAKAGNKLPTVLPADLIPPTNRRQRTSSIQSGGSGGTPVADVLALDSKDNDISLGLGHTHSLPLSCPQNSQMPPPSPNKFCIHNLCSFIV